MSAYVAWLAFAVILQHCLRAAHRSSFRSCSVPRWRFVALSMGFAAAPAGALGVALQLDWAGLLISVGAACYLVGNRRACINESREVAQ